MLAERAVLEVKVFLPQRRRLDDVAVGIEYRKVFLRHLLLHTMFCDHWPAAKLSTVPDHRVPSPGHSSTGPSAADRTTARQKASADGLYQATPTSHRPARRANSSPAARQPTLCRRYLRNTKNSPTAWSSGDQRFTKAKPAKRLSAWIVNAKRPSSCQYESSPS